MQESFANGTFANQLWRDFAAPFASRNSLILLATLSLFAGLVGPFGTYGDFPVATRLFYWTVMVVGTASVGHVSATAFERLLRKTGWPAFAQQPLLSVLVALPVCLVVAAISAVFGFSSFPGSLLVLYAQCVAVTGFVVILFNLTPSAPAQETAAPVLETPTPTLLDRLPPARRGRIRRLMAQDHYVEVVTENGTALVAMRFKDAIAATAPEPGLQVHRSHWVALHAVTSRATSDKRSGLRLSDGSFVPVGRSFTSSVKNTIPR